MISKTSISFSPLIIGTMRLGEWGANMSTQELENFIDACLDLGLNDFDHADIYGNYTDEGKFGAVLKRRPDLKSKVQITTKCGIRLVSPNRPEHSIKSYDSTKEHITWSVENSLKELGLEQLDVLLIHRPDYLMDPHAIAEAFTALRFAGKVKEFGVSNFSSSQFEMLNSLTPLITNQIEISPLHRAAFENGVLDQCLYKGIIPTAWSPFGGGALFAKSEDPSVLKIQAVITALCRKHNVSADKILIAWLKKHPAGIIPILGTAKIERIKDAQEALSLKLSHEDWYSIWEAALGHEVA